MKLWVRVVEARRLRGRDLTGSSDPYVRVKIADKKFRTKTVKKSFYPYWGEEFSFEIDDLDEDLLIYVMDEDKLFKNNLVGRLQINIEMVYDSPNKSLGTKWYDLHPKSKKSKRKNCGEILLSVLFSEDNPILEVPSSNRNRAHWNLDIHADQASESSSLGDILGLPIVSPSQSSSIEEDKPFAEVFTPRPTQGNGKTSTNRMGWSMPGSLETPKLNMHRHNGNDNIKGQHSRSSPGSPETLKFKMHSHNKYETDSRSVPGSPEAHKFKMHGHNVFESNTKNQHLHSVPGSPETPKFKMYGDSAYESKIRSEHSQSSSSTEAEETTSSIIKATSSAQVFMAYPNPVLPRNGETTSTSKTSRFVPSSPETLKFKTSADNDYESKTKRQHSDKNLDDGTSMETNDEVRVPGLTETVQFDETYKSKTSLQHVNSSFDDTMRSMEAKDRGLEVPSNLPGGILVDQLYAIASHDLNVLLFSPESHFTTSLAYLKGNKKLQQEPWRFGNDGEILTRTVTYIRAATKRMKAIKAVEEQTYLKANGKVFAVLVSVSTPDAMYGSTFKAETLYCITPGSVLPSGENTSKLVISWCVNFLQNTMMNGIIEDDVWKGFKESFEQFSSLLAQNVKPADLIDQGSNKEQVLASLYSEKHSDVTLATQYLLNSTVIFTAFMGLYIFMHILLTMPRTYQGLEFGRLDLPDSIAEMIICTILVLQVQRALPMISSFFQARVQRGSDHGVNGQGNGWMVTIALIEGSTLAAVDSTGFSDPYVIITCNSKTKTSSIKFQNLNPQWNEVFEFYAMDDPPSILDVEVFDFGGPFDEATSLGHTEINFVTSNISDLADIWIPLKGKLAEEYQSKLHLRIFLDNTKGNNAIKEYLTKVEKEVGKKTYVPSPQINTAFQILFGLPSEEFLINDFTCHLKRTMLLQGRIFLSARIIGFHANLFGNRTTFFFLWEDIEDIQVLSPTLTSMSSPSLIILWRGKGLDALHGAKKEDEEGRLKLHFLSFVSFNVAHRTIMTLWKAKSLSPEQKMQIIEEESERNDTQTEESGSLLDLEDASMSEVYSSDIHVPMKFFMELFRGGYLDIKVMEKVGCLDYSHMSWELVKPDVYQRQICYKFAKHVSRNRGEVTSTQQLSSNKENGWTVEEVLTLHRIPLSDYFTVHCRYQVEDLSKSNSCAIKIFFGIAWHKSTKHQKRLTTNIVSNVVNRMKLMFSLVEQEYTQEH